MTSQAYHPKIKKIKDQGLSTKDKIVSKYCNISKTLGRVPPCPSTTLYHGGGRNLRVRPRVKKQKRDRKNRFRLKIYIISFYRVNDASQVSNTSKWKGIFKQGLKKN